ncbi:L-threonylcarbamoyladenylate synthase [Flavobacteriales bacterium]|jgi:tRNA threonylcarbamoyl adenosine modification protein (Sua5/YciO/YrdC/YwlC family)|nr:L-threonylcarbamoyladenylate synthase [Flavobacteriales bacterium]
MLKRIYNEQPNQKQIDEVVKCLRNGGVIIYPTDTVYGLGCDLNHKKALERVARIKGVKLKDAHFSFVCYDLSHLSEYAKQISTQTYKLLKRIFPGPFTVILNATGKIPKIFSNKKKTVGIRIPDNNITREIVKQLGSPIISTSIHDEDDIIEYSTDPELIYEKYKHNVDMVIDGGYGLNVASTVVDCTDENEYLVKREGKGDSELIY